MFQRANKGGGGSVLNPVAIISGSVGGYTYTDITVDNTKQYMLFVAIVYNGIELNNVFYINKGVLTDVKTTGNLPTTMLNSTTVRVNYDQSMTQPYLYTLVQLD